MRTRVQLVLSVLGVAALATGAHADGAKVGGQIEANYTYNFNKPATRSNTYLFNTNDASFDVNHAELNVTKDATADSAGYVLRLFDGKIQQAFNLMYGTGNVLEAFGTTLHNWGSKELKLDFGQFASHVGYEGATVSNGQFFSRSFSRQYLQPFLLSGLRAMLPLSDNTNLGIVLANRFNGVKDPSNRDLAFGFRLHREISERSNLAINGLYAREDLANGNAGGVLQNAPVHRSAQVTNVVYTNKINESTDFAIDGTLRGGKDISNRSYTATGIAGYLTKTQGNGNVVGLRGEYVSQSNATSAILPQYTGVDANRKPSMTSITASYELKGSFPGAKTLIEFRYDRAGGAIFSSNNGVKKDQTSLTFGQVFKF